MDFHSYVTHVLVRPGGAAWGTRALHPLLSLCSAATRLDDTVRAGHLDDALTRAAIVVTLEALEAARALACFHYGLDPQPPRRLARRGPSLARAAREQASLARAIVAVGGARSSPAGQVRRLASLLASFDRRRAYVYRAVGLRPEDVWPSRCWAFDELAAGPGMVESVGRWQVFA